MSGGANMANGHAPSASAPASLAGFAAWAVVGIVIAAAVLVRDGGRDGSMLPAPRVAPPIHRVDLAQAGADEIALLPEIGPRLAATIVADRDENGPFESVDDLLRVRGIGPAKLALLAECARVGDEAESRGTP
jgi:competence ComEA-like helix-hairpin-helix protein